MYDLLKICVVYFRERMTAKECFSHEWLAEVSINSVSCEETINPRTENDKESIQCIEDTNEEIGYTKEEEKLNNEVNDDSEGTGHIRNTFEKQTSEMSVTEERVDEGVFVNSESNSPSDTELPSKLTEDPLKVENTTPDQVSDVDYDEPVNDEIANILSVNNETNSDVTVDTDISMCLSDSTGKLQEVDSGMVTGSEPIDISGRTSVELEPDTELNSETNDNIEMLNNSCIESDIKDEMESLTEGTNNDVFDKTGLSLVENRKIENVEDISEDIETGMDVEMLDPSDSSKPLEVNETNYVNNHTKDKEHSEIEGSSLPSEIIINKQETRDQTLYPPASQSNSESKASNSVNYIDDSINSMQLGESLKRGMCSETVTSGENNSQENAEEYEFVSVSKRVRSYEDNMILKKSPTYSPKTARSPRIGKHSRLNHQHH